MDVLNKRLKPLGEVIKEISPAEQIKLDARAKLDEMGAFTLDKLMPLIRLENKEIEASMIETKAFFLPKIRPGQIYTLVGTTNSGKTWNALGSSISWAREGKEVVHISTEDSINDIISYMDTMPDKDELYARIRFIFIEQETPETLMDKLVLFAAAGYEIYTFDYIRASVIAGHDGNLHLTMNKWYNVLRAFLNLYRVAIVAYIQANASMYKGDLVKKLMEDPESILTGLDGGYTPALRSQVLAMLVKNDSGERGMVILKAKFPYTDSLYKIKKYNIDGSNFQLTYEDREYSVAEFFGVNNPQDMSSVVKTKAVRKSLV